jgi:hypothetical protein
MSTSLLYQASGLVGYRQVRQAFQGGRVTLKIEQSRKRLRCSQCGSDNVWTQGGTDRTFPGGGTTRNEDALWPCCAGSRDLSIPSIG